MIENLDLNGVYFNEDYSPYAKARTEDMKTLCESKEIDCKSFFDYYLYQPGSVKTTTGTYFNKYTPFYNEVVSRPVKAVSKVNVKNLTSFSNSFNFDFTLSQAFKKYASKNSNILVHGGRTLGLKKLQEAKKQQKNYQEDRDYFTYKTTHMSAYLKYGCVSVREMYEGLKNNHGVIRELIWREFFAHVLHVSEVVGESYQRKYRKLKWSKNKDHLEKWKTGKTGFPIVDACMKTITRYMHNRGRMTRLVF